MQFFIKKKFKQLKKINLTIIKINLTIKKKYFIVSLKSFKILFIVSFNSLS